MVKRTIENEKRLAKLDQIRFMAFGATDFARATRQHWHHWVESHRGRSILVQTLESHMIVLEGEYSVMSEMDCSVSLKQDSSVVPCHTSITRATGTV